MSGRIAGHIPGTFEGTLPVGRNRIPPPFALESSFSLHTSCRLGSSHVFHDCLDTFEPYPPPILDEPPLISLLVPFGSLQCSGSAQLLANYGRSTPPQLVAINYNVSSMPRERRGLDDYTAAEHRMCIEPRDEFAFA